MAVRAVASDPDVLADARPRLAATVGPLVESGAGALTIHDALRALAKLGYSAVQWPVTVPTLRPRDFDATARRGLASTLHRMELTLSGVDAWIPPGHLLDPTTVDRAVEAIIAAVRFAAELVGPRGERPNVSVLLPAPPTSEEGKMGNRIALGDAVAHIALVAEREGVLLADHSPLALGPNGGGESSWPRVRMGVDPALLIAAGRDPAAEVTRFGPKLAAARLVDCFRSGLRGPIGESGESRLDVMAYRVALDLAEFRAPLTVDARQWRDPLGGLERTMERWAGALPTPRGARES
jgi:sugar phosphate isomerase/epimerase